jgi:2-hydroxy-6-oxonona-2,4-dienedioate hydrolase
VAALDLASAPAQAFRLSEQRLFDHYGLQVEERFLDLPKPPLRARVLVAGDGPPLVMVHGGLSVAASWAPLMSHLTGYRVYAVDRSGCGLTDGWDHRRDDFRQHATDFLSSVLDGLGLERAPVVANSMGALWSLWLAVAYPQRVTRLALLGCPALLEGTSAPFLIRLMSLPGLNGLLFGQMKPSLASARRVMVMQGHPPTLERVPTVLLEMNAAGTALPTFRTHMLSLLESAQTLLGPRRRYLFGGDLLRKLSCPVLLIWGEHDSFGSVAAGRQAASRMRDARVEVVGVGHLPWMDEPELCGDLVRAFLAES